jgi:hypothetical protein
LLSFLNTPEPAQSPSEERENNPFNKKKANEDEGDSAQDIIGGIQNLGLEPISTAPANNPFQNLTNPSQGYSGSYSNPYTTQYSTPYTGPRLPLIPGYSTGSFGYQAPQMGYSQVSQAAASIRRPATVSGFSSRRERS